MCTVCDVFVVTLSLCGTVTVHHRAATTTMRAHCDDADAESDERANPRTVPPYMQTTPRASRHTAGMTDEIFDAPPFFQTPSVEGELERLAVEETGKLFIMF